MSQPIRGRSSVFRISPKTQTWLRTLRSSFLSSFWILLRGFRGEVENSSANQRPGLSSCFSIDPKTINLVGDVEILLPVNFRWILFSGFRGEIENCPCQSETRAAILDVLISRKNTNSMEDVEILFPVKFLNSVKGFQRRSRKCLSKSETETVILFFSRPENHKLSRWCWDLASCQVSLNSVQRF